MTGLEAVRAMISKVDSMTNESNAVTKETITYEHKEFYDSYGTGNYSEDKSGNFTLEITKEQAKKYGDMWLEMGFSHYETSKAYVYEKQWDARHFAQYILYK